jgi:hypothetical protein
MARRRHGTALATPGGFSRGNFGSAPCALCGVWCTLGNGWLHVQTSSVVCPTCMLDPWAEEPRERVALDADPAPPRYVGDRVAAQLRAAMGMPAA